MTLVDVAAIVSGTVVGDASLVVRGVSTDSRTVQPGDLYCAIVGDRVDGHDFVDQAIERGAVAVLSSRAVSAPSVLLSHTSTRSGAGDIDVVISALGTLAAHDRLSWPQLHVIGVTGSSGKTSTKDLIGQVLRSAGPTVAPAGSPNNELGLPMTLLTVDAGTRYVVTEMGMRGIGHIEYLCEIARPSSAVVTNVGHAHVGEVGSIEAVALAKSELVTAIPATGHVILNADDFNVVGMASKSLAPVVTFGRSDSADVRASNVSTTEIGGSLFELSYGGESVGVELALVGEHQISNALAAASVGIVLGMDLDAIARALCNATLVSKWRMEVHHIGSAFTLINDAYNANPESMEAALKALIAIPQAARTWAVLGAMHELGDESISEHDRIGRLAVRLDVDQLVVVGQSAKAMHLGALQEGSWDNESVWLPDFSAAADYIVENIGIGDVVLFKASRSEGFEKLAEDVERRLRARQEGSQE